MLYEVITIFMIYYIQKNYSQAINYGLKLVELNPSNSDDIMQNIAKSYTQLKDYKKAIDILDKSLKYSLSRQKLAILMALCSKIKDSSRMEYYQKLIADSNK